MNNTQSDGNPFPGAYSNWHLIRRMLGLAWEYRWGCIAVVALQLTLLAFGITGLSFMGLGIDYIRYELARAAENGASAVPENETVRTTDKTRAPANTHSSVAKEPSWPAGIRPPRSWSPLLVIAFIAGAILGLAALRALINLQYILSVTRLVQARIVVALRSRVYEKMQRLSFRFFDANASGSLINRVTGDVQAVRGFVDGVVMQSIILALSLCVYLFYMLNIHVWLTIACLASSPLLWYFTSLFSRTVRPAYFKNRVLFDNQILTLSENLQGIHVVKGFAREKEQVEKFRAASAAVRDQKQWVFRMVTLFQPLIGYITHVNLAVLLGYGGYLVVRFEQAPDARTAALVGLSVGQLLVFATFLQQFSGQIANIANIANTMQQSLTAAQRVFEVLDAPVEIAAPRNPVRVRKIDGDVCFENVTFGFSPDEPVLHDISFCVKPGQLVAVLGPTGSGKSALLGLIPRFYDPLRGRVLIDNHDARSLDLDQLRRSIGMVFQESFLFSNSVAANIAFGCSGATREQVEKAARIAAAHRFITALPRGYDTILHEGGSDLSGGQRQRLAIARAILLEPPILLLDDPTAAVDPGTEEDILGAMENAMEGRTTFIVSHRLSTLRRADIVMVLDRGRIVQAGAHSELMGVAGHYRRAARLQIPDSESLEALGNNAGDYL